MLLEEYHKALRQGLKEVKAAAAAGKETGLLVLPDSMEAKAVRRESLGVVEIPMELIDGTYNAMRRDDFSPGFFPVVNENSEFARLVIQCGLIWVGPSPDIIDMLGNKSAARKMMKEAGVPVIPGSKEVIETVEQGKKVAEDIGYPVMIKASNGGGGRGMRVVHNEEEFETQYLNAKAEAKACFGDDDVYLEKLIAF